MVDGHTERALAVHGRVAGRIAHPLGDLGLAAVALLVGAVPLLWAAAVAGVVWGLAALVIAPPVTSRVGAVALGLVGSLLLVAMLRPVLAPPVQPAGRLALGPHEALAWTRFARAVAAAVGTRAPRWVAVDAGVDVRLVQGRLVIGLGLVAALSRGSLAALVGSELARAGQGTSAGQCVAFIEQVDAWLARASEGRDRWAPAMDRFACSGGAWRLGRPLAWVDAGLRAVLSAVRWGLGVATAGVRRRRALAADRFAAELVGSAVFIDAVAQQRRAQGIARRAGWQQVAHALDRGRLCEDLPRLIALDLRAPSAERPAADGGDGGGPGPWPAPADRLRVAQGTEWAGVIDDDRPAASLFEGFTALCQAATRARFAGLVRHADEPLQWVDAQAFRADRAVVAAEVDLLDGFLGGGRVGSRRVLAAAGPGTMSADPVGDLQRLRARGLTGGASLTDARRALVERDLALQNVRQGAELVALGSPCTPADYGVPAASPAAFEAAIAAHRQARRAAEAELAALEGEVTARLALAGALAFDPQFGPLLAGVAEQRAQWPALWQLAGGLRAAAAPLAALHDAVMVLTIHTQQGVRDVALYAQRRERVGEAWAGLWHALPDLPCPLHPELPVRDWLLGAQKLSPVDPMGVFAAYRRLVPRFDAVSWRVLVGQAQLAAAVEAGLLDGLSERRAA